MLIERRTKCPSCSMAIVVPIVVNAADDPMPPLPTVYCSECQIEILVAKLNDSSHSYYCDAIKNPSGEMWMLDGDCDCWLKSRDEIITAIRCCGKTFTAQ